MVKNSCNPVNWHSPMAGFHLPSDSASRATVLEWLRQADLAERAHRSDRSVTPISFFNWKRLGEGEEDWSAQFFPLHDHVTGLAANTFVICESIAVDHRLLTSSSSSSRRGTMATKSIPNPLRSVFAATWPRPRSTQPLKCPIAPRNIHHTARTPAFTASRGRHRPILQPHHQPSFLPTCATSLGSRTIFIQTQSTPNADVSSRHLSCSQAVHNS